MRRHSHLWISVFLPLAIAAQPSQTTIPTVITLDGKGIESRTSARADAIASTDVRTRAKAARSAMVRSKTGFLAPEALESKLIQNPGFQALGIKLVRERGPADLEISVERAIFTRRFTFTVVDSHTTMVLAAGTIRALNGDVAAARVAAKLTAQLGELRKDAPPQPVRK